MKIDWWTLGFQTVNVVVLVWLLRHFFWRPVAALIAARREASEKSLSDAKATLDKAAAGLADIAKTRAGFAKEHDDLLATAHRDADAARIATLAEASKKAEAAQAAAKLSIGKERADAEAAWSDGASRLAVEIAGRLAARLQGAAVDAAFLDWLLAAIRALPEAARRSAASDGAIIEAVSARPLAAAEQDRYRVAIAEAFDAHLQIAFKNDASLIDGMELHGPHFTLSNSWRADLATVLADLRHAA